MVILDLLELIKQKFVFLFELLIRIVFLRFILVILFGKEANGIVLQKTEEIIYLTSQFLVLLC